MKKREYLTNKCIFLCCNKLRNIFLWSKEKIKIYENIIKKVENDRIISYPIDKNYIDFFYISYKLNNLIKTTKKNLKLNEDILDTKRLVEKCLNLYYLLLSNIKLKRAHFLKKKIIEYSEYNIRSLIDKKVIKMIDQKMLPYNIRIKKEESVENLFRQINEDCSVYLKKINKVKMRHLFIPGNKINMSEEWKNKYKYFLNKNMLKIPVSKHNYEFLLCSINDSEIRKEVLFLLNEPYKHLNLDKDIIKILKKRYDLSNMLGYENWIHYCMDEHTSEKNNYKDIKEFFDIIKKKINIDYNMINGDIELYMNKMNGNYNNEDKKIKKKKTGGNENEKKNENEKGDIFLSDNRNKYINNNNNNNNNKNNNNYYYYYYHNLYNNHTFHCEEKGDLRCDNSFYRCEKKKICLYDWYYYYNLMNKRIDEYQINKYFPQRYVLDNFIRILSEIYNFYYTRINNKELERKWKKDTIIYRIDIKGKQSNNLLLDSFLGYIYIIPYIDINFKDYFRISNINSLSNTYVICNGHVVINCNFMRTIPIEEKLFSISEIISLFHEFGHAYHLLLLSNKYKLYNLNNIPLDYAEFFSHMNEYLTNNYNIIYNLSNEKNDNSKINKNIFNSFKFDKLRLSHIYIQSIIDYNIHNINPYTFFKNNNNNNNIEHDKDLLYNFYYMIRNEFPYNIHSFNYNLNSTSFPYHFSSLYAGSVLSYLLAELRVRLFFLNQPEFSLQKNKTKSLYSFQKKFYDFISINLIEKNNYPSIIHYVLKNKNEFLQKM
ncbi:putative DnaJ protein [Plasmodium gaboni]|uniref:Putative DnaJ protein n=1 Tax=Plasmodium gaboni TaxID=647221 RepID=A0A151LKG3_9APIC|nr:putative DnaJ protein [Plasmodium gaboni]KYN99434.1 putative DnaJ protein [Plasmodium gaboni]